MDAAFHELPSLQCFPFTVEFLNAETSEVIHAEQVTAPGVMFVPALAHRFGVPIAVRVVTPDGDTAENWPEGT